jgi:hypothetical protein
LQELEPAKRVKYKKKERKELERAEKAIEETKPQLNPACKVFEPKKKGFREIYPYETE